MLSLSIVNTVIKARGCLSIVDAVVEATLSSKQRSEDFGKGKKRRQRQRESTPLNIFQGCFAGACQAHKYDNSLVF